MDKLAQLKAAIAEILDDDRVAEILDGGRLIGYRVCTPDAGTVLVLPRGDGQWAVHFDTDDLANARPLRGMPGSVSDDPQHAVAWALQ